MKAPFYDVAVIGGGIVGVASAHALSTRRDCRVVILEAEPELARHQSGRNSGVIHSGLYYRPGSHKARLCGAGRERLYRFCAEREIPHRRCGKLVVATSESELAALAELERRAAANRLEGVEQIDPKGIRELEPAAAGIGALWVPQTGVVDFRRVTMALASEVERHRGTIAAAARVRAIVREGPAIRLLTAQRTVQCRVLLNCAGLYSDRLARLAGLDPGVRIVPFRGRYFELGGDARELVRRLIYPVPDPRLPFLGVHLTRTVDDRVLAGPNAVLALKREGYRAIDISLRDMAEFLTFPGFWRLAARFWRTGIAEAHRAVDRHRFVTQLQRLVPAVSTQGLQPAATGVRAQALDRDGNLLDDFSILQRQRMVHVLNAPSPAATAALAIGDYIAELAFAHLG